MPFNVTLWNLEAGLKLNYTSEPEGRGLGLGFRVQGSGFRVQGLGFRV